MVQLTLVRSKTDIQETRIDQIVVFGLLFVVLRVPIIVMSICHPRLHNDLNCYLIQLKVKAAAMRKIWMFKC